MKDDGKTLNIKDARKDLLDVTDITNGEKRMVEENEIFWKSILHPVQCNFRGHMDKCNDGTGLPCCFYCSENKKCRRIREGEYEPHDCLKEGQKLSTCQLYVDFLNKEKRKNDKKP
jgi:hypothetical protein